MKRVRGFFKGTLVGAFAFYMACVLAVSVTGSMVAGCTASQVEADIQKVIADIPTAVNIAESIITIIAAAQGKGTASPAALADVTKYSGEVSADLKLTSSLLAQYEANLATAPHTVIGQLDAAAADAQANLGAILTSLHVVDTSTAEAVGFAVAGVQAVLLAVQSLLPASMAQFAPRTVQALAAIGAAPGAVKFSLVSARSLAKGYNGKVKKLYPRAVVPVPAMHFLGIPL